MSWNYRIFRLEKDGEACCQIREAYYHAGELDAFSENPIHPQGETLAELRGDLVLMERAFDLPVLTAETAVGTKAPPRSKSETPDETHPRHNDPVLIAERDQAIQERDEARFFARRLLDFIDEGCFRDDLPMGEDDSPEWELWVKSQVVAEVAFQIRQKWPAEQEPADAETRKQPNPRHEDPAR